MKGLARFKNGALHVQVAGPAGNRAYGYSFDIPIDTAASGYALGTAMAGIQAVAKSLAGTDAIYKQVDLGRDAIYFGADMLAINDAGFKTWYDNLSRVVKTVAAQVRVRGDMLHFQIPGKAGNRNYGWSVDVPADHNTLATTGNVSCSQPSLAGTGNLYADVSLSMLASNVIYMNLNMPDGGTFVVTLNSPELVSAITAWEPVKTEPQVEMVATWETDGYVYTVTRSPIH